MTSRTHPYHPVIAIFPMSLLAASVALDAVAFARHLPYFAAARFALGAGAIAGVLVSITGIVDYQGYPRGARGVPFQHGGLNGSMVVLMVFGWWRRSAAPKAPPDALAIALSLAAAAIAIVAWRLATRLTPAPPDVRRSAQRA